MNEVFRALNDKTRREILILLRKENMSAGDIAGHFEMSKASISHHLEVLRNADLITRSRKGQFLIYSLNTTIIDDILQWFMHFKNKDNEK